MFQRATVYDVNGLRVQIGMHPFIKLTLWLAVVLWICFCVYAYQSLDGRVSVNSANISLITGVNGEYMEILGKRESDNDYNIVGGYNNHYLGCYQHGRSSLKDIGVINTRKDYRKFRANFIAHGTDFWSEQDQQRACYLLMKKNSEYLKNHYKYIGKTIGGVLITEAGLLSASHLVGAGAVIEFLESNGSIVAEDGFNTKLTHYMKLMENVKVEI